MNETERLILEGLYHILNEDDSFTFEKKAICIKIQEALAPKEDDGLAEQRDKDLEDKF